MAACRAGEVAQARHEFGHDTVPLGVAVARVQGGQLHRNARPGEDVAAARRAADGSDRIGVGSGVALGVVFGPRALAQHVVGEAVAGALRLARRLQRLGDGTAHDELAAHDAHHLEHGAAHDGPAAACRQPAEDGAQVAILVGTQQAAGQHQRPGRGVDERRTAVAEVALPIAVEQLVSDQQVGGGRVGDAQQRLGEAHEGDALAVGQVVLVQEGIEAADRGRAAAHLLDQGHRARLDPRPHLRRGVELRHQRLAPGGLVGAPHLRDAPAQRVEVGRIGEDQGRRRHGREPFDRVRMMRRLRSRACRRSCPRSPR